jgi:hypothetical protein
MTQSDFNEAEPQWKAVYSGGSGTSIEDAVVITVPLAFLGIPFDITSFYAAY